MGKGLQTSGVDWRVETLWLFWSTSDKGASDNEVIYFYVDLLHLFRFESVSIDLVEP